MLFDGDSDRYAAVQLLQHTADVWKSRARTPTRNCRQRKQALVGQRPSQATSLSTQAAVLVLVEHIKNPGLSFEQIAAHLQQQQALSVTSEGIRRFFEEHDLKRTPET